MHRLRSWLRRTYLSWLLPASLLLGTTLRLREWLYDKSLWLDEIAMAANLSSRGFGQLVHGLSGSQAAPIGWLWAERAAIDVFGTSELALRLVPLLGSLVALAVFPQVATRLIGATATPFATLLVATSPPLIYYAAETKQYSTDVSCALLAVLATTYLWDRPPAVRSYLLWGLACGALSWCSQPTILISTACTALLIIRWIRRRGSIWPLTAGVALLGTILATEWFGQLRSQAANQTLQTYWQLYGGYPRTPAGVGSDLRWVLAAADAFTHGFARIALPVLALALAAWGLAVLARSRPWSALLLGLICVGAVGAAVTQHYPLAQRLALYLVPALVLLLTAGLGYAEARPDYAPPARARTTAVLVCAVGLMLTTAPTIGIGSSKLWQPDETTAGRQTLEFVAHHWEPGDLLLTDIWANPDVTYYGPRDGLRGGGTIAFRTVPPGTCTGDRLAPLSGHRRVWVVLTHHPTDEPADRNQIYASQLHTAATELLSFQGQGDTAAYLFDLASPPAAPVPALPTWLPAGCFTVTLRS